eukprot:TRINITY_DN5234_c0_g1_i1.p1 TRINITY_DN5234_c0_g1~~TRINITY_DN5234_c0_g1_i1.p1  ORF type:complete len:172 (+),score=2.69 TRINITY_DN5234_c0_g1_i1:861-1376(+)
MQLRHISMTLVIVFISSGKHACTFSPQDRSCTPRQARVSLRTLSLALYESFVSLDTTERPFREKERLSTDKVTALSTVAPGCVCEGEGWGGAQEERRVNTAGKRYTTKGIVESTRCIDGWLALFRSRLAGVGRGVGGLRVHWQTLKIGAVVCALVECAKLENTELSMWSRS